MSSVLLGHPHVKHTLDGCMCMYLLCWLYQIEPWGRQFFVFNAWEAIRPEKWKGPRGGAPRLPPVLDDQGQPVANQTVMCVCDYSRKPLMYLMRPDVDHLVRNLGFLKQQLYEFKEKQLPDDFVAIASQEYLTKRILMPYRHYGMQRTKTGGHLDGKGTMRGRKREPRT
eukprot:GHVT01099843.1.p1 GENE.GHVT01099843.1~~GHVT01099843.1.p1  ORF type:complete len:169 (+),score=2.35 GHVT01099843.1:498-1004(+)